MLRLAHILVSPMDEPMGDITHLLHRWRAGSREAENQLFTLVLPNLRRLAHYLMQRERKDHSLQATELVDQIYFRMVAAKERDWQNRKHFYAIAARAMRRHLIDHARGRPAAEFVALEGFENILPADSPKVDLAIAVVVLACNLLGDGLRDRFAIVAEAAGKLVGDKTLEARGNLQKSAGEVQENVGDLKQDIEDSRK